MIKSLRKRHLKIWMVIAFLLPLGMISAWLVIPQPGTDHLLQPGPSTALPVVLKKYTNPDYSVSLRSSKDGSLLQLEWINQTALTVPSALIYRTNAGAAESAEIIGEIIGRVGPRGIYRFPLKMEGWETGMHFLLYDFIHHRLLDRINL